MDVDEGQDTLQPQPIEANESVDLQPHPMEVEDQPQQGNNDEVKSCKGRIISV